MEKLLLVNDNKTICNIIADFLTDQGYDVQIAVNGKEGLDFVKVNQLDLVLLDIEMPVMDGFEAAREIRKIKNALELPILFLSAAFKDIASKYKGLESGGNDYITFPFEENELLFKINSLIRVKNLSTELAIYRTSARQSEKRFEAIFENLAEGVIIVNQKSKKVHLVNNRFTQMTGYGFSELEKMAIPRDLHFERDLPMVLEKFKGMADGKITPTKGILVKRKNNSHFYATISVANFSHEGEKYLIANFRDITDQLKSESDLDLFRTLIDQSNDALFIIDDLSIGTHPSTWMEYSQSKMIGDLEVIGEEERIYFWKGDFRELLFNLRMNL